MHIAMPQLFHRGEQYDAKKESISNTGGNTSPGQGNDGQPIQQGGCKG